MLVRLGISILTCGCSIPTYLRHSHTSCIVLKVSYNYKHRTSRGQYIYSYCVFYILINVINPAALFKIQLREHQRRAVIIICVAKIKSGR